MAEPGCWRTYRSPNGAALVVKPDAYVVSAEPDYEHLSFVEVDLGTEGQTAIRRKAQRYHRYWSCGQEQHQLGVFPRIVFLAPSDERVERLRRWLAPAPPGPTCSSSASWIRPPCCSAGRCLAGGAANGGASAIH